MQMKQNTPTAYFAFAETKPGAGLTFAGQFEDEQEALRACHKAAGQRQFAVFPVLPPRYYRLEIPEGAQVPARVEAPFDVALTDFPDHLPHIEARIIATILDDALAQPGVTVDVYDGEDTPVSRSRDRAEIEHEIAATSDTTLVFRDAAGERLGWVWLVHGNIGDVLTDYGNNEWTNALVARASNLADRISEEGV